MLCTWKDKSHKICINKCDNGCARKRAEEYQSRTKELFAKSVTDSVKLGIVGVLCGPLKGDK